MENYDFVLENIRFHLIEKDTLIFNGWFRDDNPDNRKIEVYLDDSLIPAHYEIKKGIEVRQKYLYRNANINEEIFGTVVLPQDWKERQKLIVKSVKEGSSAVSCSIKVTSLIERQSEVEYYIETEELAEGKMTLAGWAMGEIGRAHV